MRVAVVVLNNFLRDSRVKRTALALARLGLQPRVVALHDPGLPEIDDCDGVPVLRIRLLSRAWGTSFLVRLLKYFEFLVRALVSCWDCSTVHCNDINCLPVGVALRLVSSAQVRVVYDAHEHETEVIGLSKAERVGLRLVERVLLRSVAAVFTVSDSIAEDYSRIYGIKKPRVVLNCPEWQPTRRSAYLREHFKLSGAVPIFVHQGALIPGRGISALIAAFSILGPQAVIVFLGYGPLQDQIVKASETQPNILFHPAVAPNRLLEITASADFGVCTIENTCMSSYWCLPNKLFEYLMAGLPVLVSDLPEMRRLVSTHAVGLAVPENSVAALVDAVTTMVNVGRQAFADGIRGAQRIYMWEEQESVIRDTYLPLLRSASTRRMTP